MRGLLKACIAGFIIVNAITVILSYTFPVGREFTDTFALILFFESAMIMVFGGLLGTFLGRIIFYGPFGNFKGRDTTGKDESDEKRTDAGIPLIVLGIILMIEVVLLAAFPIRAVVGIFP